MPRQTSTPSSSRQPRSPSTTPGVRGPATLCVCGDVYLTFPYHARGSLVRGASNAQLEQQLGADPPPPDARFADSTRDHARSREIRRRPAASRRAGASEGARGRGAAGGDRGGGGSLRLATAPAARRRRIPPPHVFGGARGGACFCSRLRGRAGAPPSGARPRRRPCPRGWGRRGNGGRRRGQRRLVGRGAAISGHLGASRGISAHLGASRRTSLPSLKLR